MNHYTICCTPEQTRKAGELGAPLKTFIHVEPEFSMANGCLPYPEEIEMYEYPTAEQMIGWLEEQIGILSIEITFESQIKWKWELFAEDTYDMAYPFYSRKEATLAAIDATLEYLTKNKK